jgi:hypothetical protein
MQAADDRNEANDALRAALTEALAFTPDWADFENGRECGRLDAAQPVAESAILARGRFHAFKGENGEPDDWEWFEAGTNCEHGCVDALIVRADSIQAAQPVREPEFTGLPKRKLDDLLAQGYKINGVSFQREQEGATWKRGFITYGGMVGWWHGENEQAQPVREPDLSSLSPKAQVRIREWLADGTFVERAIGTMREQERELSARESLTEAQLSLFYAKYAAYQEDSMSVSGWIEFGRAIEQAHGIGGGDV